MKEEWKPIEGHHGMYSISSFGNVRSECKTITHFDGRSYSRPAALMHPASGVRQKYKSVRLRGNDGKYKTHYIHTLVLVHFIGARPDGMEACHCDGDATNNAVSNLRWDTRTGNMRDKDAHGTSPVGERHPASKLTDSLVRALRTRRQQGASITVLASEFGVSRMAASRAASKTSWSHVV